MHDIDVYAHPGEQIAFVGATGAGKTTVSKEICEKLGYEDELLDVGEPFGAWVIESEKYVIFSRGSRHRFRVLNRDF